MKSLLSALLVSAAVATPALAASDVVTIYAADGLHDGKGSWFETQFDAFTKATGVKVQYVEAGSGGVVERVAKEKSNPQADVLVTLPPFIQRAETIGKNGGLSFGKNQSQGSESGALCGLARFLKPEEAAPWLRLIIFWIAMAAICAGL